MKSSFGLSSRHCSGPNPSVKNDLDLGRNLFAFAAEHAPMHLQMIESFFRQRGAYARFKKLLETTQLLDRWYVYEAAATRRALEAWAGENGFAVVQHTARKWRSMTLVLIDRVTVALAVQYAA